MRLIRATNYLPRVKVAEGVVVLKLCMEVEVPVSQFADHVRDLFVDVEVGEIRPILDGGGNGGKSGRKTG